jgi:hypothetical protein
VLLPYYVNKGKDNDFENQGRPQIWGYIDRGGKAVIQPAFHTAGSFNSKGIAIISVLEKDEVLYGLIDQTGSMVLEPKYMEIRAYDGVFVALNKERHSALINESGHIIKPDIAGEIGAFSEGKASIKVGELYGFVNQTGEIVVKPQFNYVQEYDNGKVLAHVGAGQDTLLNEKGERLHNYNVQYMDVFSEGLAPARLTENSKLGFINEEGELVIAEKYEIAEPFHEGLAKVGLSSYENQSGLINSKGDYVLQPQFGEIVYLGKSLWAVAKTTRQMGYNGESEPHKFALYNSKGEKISDYVFDDIQPFQGNYAVVQQGVSSFLMDETGHKSKDWPLVEGIGDLKLINNLIEANVDNELKYVTAQGDVIWQSSYSYELGNGAELKAAKYRPNRHVLSYYPVIDGLKNKAVQDKLNSMLEQEKGAEGDIDGQAVSDFDQSFSVVLHQKDLLVIDSSSNVYSGGAHGMPGEFYYHLNLWTGEAYTIQDLFKPDSNYITKLDQTLRKLIKEQGEEKGVFEDPEMGFQGLTKDNLFYVQGEALHIIFTPYEIGPYAAGFITFDIPFADLDTVINKAGAFWLSFH